MAKVLFKRKTTDEIKDLEVEDGALIYNTDNGKTYMDFGEDRIQTGGNADTMIAIGGAEAPTDTDIKIWFPNNTVDTKASEVINSMSGNQTDLAPSVDAVKKYVDSKRITYLNSTQLSNGFTPTEDCYIELYGASSGWGYAGAKTELVISNTAGNAEQIVKTQAGTQGHDIIPDSMFTTSVYKLTANVQYKFTLGGVTGGNIYSGFYGKLIPFI